jgi:hypothetical protein
MKYESCTSLKKRNWLNFLLVGVSLKLLLELKIAALANESPFNFHCLSYVLLSTVPSHTPSFYQCPITSFFFPAWGLIGVEFFSFLLHFRLNCLQWVHCIAGLACRQTDGTAAESCGLRSVLCRVWGVGACTYQNVSRLKQQYCGYLLQWDRFLFMLIRILMQSVERHLFSHN